MDVKYIDRHGNEMLFSSEDIDLVRDNSISFGKTYKKSGYFTVGTRKLGERRFHRIVASRVGRLSEGLVVDHKNGNTMDNRRCNLSITTQSINVFKAKPSHSRVSIYGFRGARPRYRNGKFSICCCLRVNGKNYLTPYRKTIEEAKNDSQILIEKLRKASKIC